MTQKIAAGTTAHPMPELETPDSVLAFWFGGASAGSTNPDATLAERQAALWWRKDPGTDAAIRTRFAAWTDRAAHGALDAWADTPQGRLALIVLTDQFPRNMYRGSPQAFAFDPLARRWCVDGLAQGADQALRPLERVFFYLPLEHSESLADQQQAVALMRRLEKAVPVDQAEAFRGYTRFAEQHLEIVARFGRFPHRNAILCRASTPDEAEFLTQPGSGF